MNATYSIWKPVDVHSGDVVRTARKKIGEKCKVGHAGTLDPFAEGILVLCFGENTKTVPDIMAMQKEYRARIRLGVETDTLDKTGEVFKTSKIPSLNKDKILEVLSSFVGSINQSPPAFSALKLNGRCLYEYARRGIRVRKKERKVEIYSIKLLDYDSDSITVTVSCGSGTYIRSLARDISNELNTVGYLCELERLSVGSYNKNNSLTLEEFKDADIK